MLKTTLQCEGILWSTCGMPPLSIPGAGIS